MAIMSLRGYAAHRGVALSAAQKAIASGRISALPDGRVDSDRADVEWERNTTQYAPAVARRGLATRIGRAGSVGGRIARPTCVKSWTASRHPLPSSGSFS